ASPPHLSAPVSFKRLLGRTESRLDDPANVDSADAAAGQRDSDGALVEVGGIVTDLNNERVRVARAIERTCAHRKIANAQAPACSPRGARNREDCNLACLEEDLQVRIVQST